MNVKADKDYTGQLKGIILFPCCPNEKVIVYEGSKGSTSNKCPRCRKMAVFNFDRMTAAAAAPIRGAVHKLKTT